MEAFSLLKYWRSASSAAASAGNKTAVAGAAAVSPCSSDGEEGPYIDLEFSPIEEEIDKYEDPKEEIETGSEITVEETEEGEEEEISMNGCEESSKIPVFLAKSATKFRVLLLKLKTSKSGGDGVSEKSEDPVFGEKQSIAVKLTADESCSETNSASSEERKLTREVTMHKYLKMVKPFYVRVSKRYAGKLKLSGRENTAARSSGKREITQLNLGNGKLQAGLKVVRKHLGKSRSTSAVATPSQAPTNRRDDSLLQLQDGIQSAILHCKKSFNASRDGESSSTTILSRPSHEKLVVMIPIIASQENEP